MLCYRMYWPFSNHYWILATTVIAHSIPTERPWRLFYLSTFRKIRCWNVFSKEFFALGHPADLTWDPQLVLDHLENLPCDSLKNLSHKLLVLLLLATGQRLQTISLISLDNIRENDNGLKVFITALIKTSGPKRPQPCLDLPFFKENLNLCVASLLKEYLKRTSSLRKDNSSALFISFKKPFSPVSKQTLSRWVKEVLQDAGIDTSIFHPHSVRHASTSKAFSRGASMDAIRKAAGWTSNSAVFAKFYNRPVTDPVSFLRSVLAKNN